MTLRSWCKNRKVAATSRRCRELQKRNIPTSRCLGLVLDQFSAHFELIIEVFKAQTRKTEGGGGGGRILGLGGNTLGFVLGELLRFVLRRGRTLEEEEDNEEEEGALMPNLFSLFPFPFFFLLMVVFTFPLMF